MTDVYDTCRVSKRDDGGTRDPQQTDPDFEENSQNHADGQSTVTNSLVSVDGIFRTYLASMSQNQPQGFSKRMIIYVNHRKVHH